VRRLLPFVAAAAVVAALAPVARADPARVGYPTAIAGIGDSITKAYNTGLRPYADDPSYSWSTGTRGSIASAYSRILAANPAIRDRRLNAAKDGARMRDFPAQAAAVVAARADYVTVMLGSNDVCRPSESSMTSVTTFRTQFDAGLRALSVGLPDARIQLVSVPDAYRLWQLYRSSFVARTVWSVAKICQSLLASPGSSSTVNAERRRRVRERNGAFNRELAAACALYIHCRYDGDAVFATAFTKGDVTRRDYFHPSRSGQAKLADVVWSRTSDFTDTVAPLSFASVSVSSDGLVVELSAFDDVGVLGVEYRIDEGPYVRYTEALALQTGQRLVYRAVDINGNIEATHELIG